MPRPQVPPVQQSPKFLVAESECPDARERRRQTVGRSSGETYAATLQQLHPGADTELVRPAEKGAQVFTPDMLETCDAVFLTGSPLHVYEDAPEVRRPCSAAIQPPSTLIRHRKLPPRCGSPTALDANP